MKAQTEVSRRGLVEKGAAALAGAAAAAAALAPARSEAIVYLDPARYGDQELKNAAIAKCRTRVRDAIVRDPKIAPQFFLLAVLDGLSYEEKTKRGGPDGSVAASVQAGDGPAYVALREALAVLQESQKALKRTNALTLSDLIALAGAESVAAIGGPELTVQLGRTDSPTLLADVAAVKKGGRKAAEELRLLPAFDVEKLDPADVSAAFKRSGFTEREAAVLLGTLAILQSPSVVNADAADKRDDKETLSKTRGKIGRASGSGAAPKKPLIDLNNLADGDEDPDVDVMEGDIENFYIADAFGTRKEAYGKRATTDTDVANFNQVFVDMETNPTKAAADSSAAKILLSNPNAKPWLKKYAAERLTFLKDLNKTFYRITEVGAQYTGGKYAALLEGRGPTKLD